MSVRGTSADVVSRASDKESRERLVTMRPVASGDNFAPAPHSTHRLKDDVPALVPCCEGRELHISEELLHSGLSAISVKHESVLECLSLTRTCERTGFVFARSGTEGGIVKHRNSFRSLHRPELRRVPCLRKMAPQELESLFRGCTAPVPKLDAPPSPAATDVASEPQVEECVRVMLPTQDESPTKIKRCRDEPAVKPINGGASESAPPPAASSLQPVRERDGSARVAACAPCGSTASAELPHGMQLHGARARLYTSVRGAGGARAPGDQLDVLSLAEGELEERPERATPGDAAATHDELHTILPPRRDLPDNSSTATNSFR